MLIKLAFKNTEKGIKDYAVYFFTLTLGVCVFYLFNSIYAQQAMMELNSKQSESVMAVMNVLDYVSAFVAVVLGFLIVYANSFFIRRRKKELGIYMILGMDRLGISAILIMETSIMALLALGTGLALGVLLSQIMSVFTACMFEVDLTHYAFVFAPAAVLKSILYFSAIFLLVMFFNSLIISRLKLIDLIQGGRVNESLKTRNSQVSWIILVLALIMLGAAYYLIIDNGMFYINRVFFASIVLGTLGTLGFFYGLSGILTVLVQSNQRLFYKDLNMFVTRQLGSKINTNFASVSVVCIVLLMTIGIFSVGYSMQMALSSDLRNCVAYDCSFYDWPPDSGGEYRSFAGLEKFLQGNENIDSYQSYRIYDLELDYTELGVALPEEVAFLQNQTISCIALSDYNRAMEMQGQGNLALGEEEYALLTKLSLVTEFTEQVLAADSPIVIDGRHLHPALSRAGTVRNGVAEVLLIVPDRCVNRLHSNVAVLNLNSKGGQAGDHFLDQLAEYEAEHSYEERNYSVYDSRVEIYAQASTSKAAVSFIAIYLGVVFMMSCAAILAIQQLADTADNLYRYDLLTKLGADEKMLNQALFRQILFYFMFPLVLAVFHSIFGLWAANDALTIHGKLDIGRSIAAAAAFVGSLYSAYFILTYTGSKNIIKQAGKPVS